MSLELLACLEHQSILEFLELPARPERRLNPSTPELLELLEDLEDLVFRFLLPLDRAKAAMCQQEGRRCLKCKRLQHPGSLDFLVSLAIQSRLETLETLELLLGLDFLVNLAILESQLNLDCLEVLELL